MPLKFGSEMGRAFPHIRSGCPYYSSHYDSADSREYPDDSSYIVRYRLSCGTEVSGLGWAHQCVGGARCGLIHLYDTSFPSVGMAYTIFELPYFEKIISPKAAAAAASEDTPRGGRLGVQKVPVIKCKNASAPSDPDSAAAGASRPLPGMLLIWHAGGFFSYTGHVAQIVDVVERSEGPADAPGKKYGVRIAESNFDDEKWSNGHYSRELPAVINERGHFEIFEDHPEGGRIKGWIGPVNMLDYEVPTSPTFLQTGPNFRSANKQAAAAAAAAEEEEKKEEAKGGQEGSGGRSE